MSADLDPAAVEGLISHQPWRDAYGRYVCIDNDDCEFVGTEREHRQHQADMLATCRSCSASQAAARAWDEGRAAVREGDVCGDSTCCPPATINPYRQEEHHDG